MAVAAVGQMQECGAVTEGLGHRVRPLGLCLGFLPYVSMSLSTKEDDSLNSGPGDSVR